MGYCHAYPCLPPVAAEGSNPTDPCSNIYTGDRPFSEVEALSLGKYLYSRRRSLKVYIDFHSYGQLWLSPWGCKKQAPRHFGEQVGSPIAQCTIYNGIYNRAEWSPIRSVIIRVITKSRESDLLITSMITGREGRPGMPGSSYVSLRSWRSQSMR